MLSVMTEPIRVGHLSDTHFLERGAAPEGGHAYDTAAAFDAVLDHLGDHDHLDMVVVTGDVADHGRPEQYALAMAAFSRFDVPVHLCPGNHDFDDPFRAGFADSGIGTPRVLEVGSWAFLFVDSNAGRMIPGDGDRLVDPPGDHRIASNGALGERESGWVRDVCRSTSAEHVFVWVHHPPGCDVPLVADADYATEWTALLGDLPEIRGIGGGHTHIPAEYSFEGRSVHVAPSLKNNFDLDVDTWLPPGYRTFEFHDDGQFTSELHLVDDERWPRRPFGRAIRSLFMGELTYAQLAEIVARRANAND